MSTISSTTLQDRVSGKNLPTASVISGVPKAWTLYMFNAGAPVNVTSFNIASISDTGLGKSGPNTTAPFATAAYATLATITPSVSWDNRNWSANPSTSTSWVVDYVEQGTVRDPGYVSTEALGVLP